MRAVSVLLAVALGGCGGNGGDADDTPAPGSRGSGITDAGGSANVNLGSAQATVRVTDAAGNPVSSVLVAVAAGKRVIVATAVDPSDVHPPGLTVYPLAAAVRTGSGPLSVVAPGDPAFLGPVVIPIVLSVIGGALSLWELLDDPVHAELVLDDGLVKSCVAGDVNDLLALLGPVFDIPIGAASKYLFVKVLGKTQTFAYGAQAGLLGFQEFLERTLGFLDRDIVLPSTCVLVLGEGNLTTRLVILSGVTSSGILAQDNGFPSTLWVVEPNAAGADFPASVLLTPQGGAPFITDLAYWDKPVRQVGAVPITDPIVYAVSFNALYRLNRATGEALAIGFLGNRGINALTFDGSGGLYAAGATGELLELDAPSGAVLRLVPLTPPVATSGDLVFVPDGRLLASVVGDFSGDRLAAINPANGAVQMIGNIGFIGVYGLAFFNQQLWGLTTEGKLLRINLQTGQGSEVRELGFRANGSGSARP